jgi:PmbA protein
MNDTDQLVDQALGILRKKSIDGYEIYLDQSSHFYVESKGRRVDTLQTSHAFGMAIRVLTHQRMGFSFVTSPHSSPSTRENVSEGVGRMIEDAIISAEATSADPCFDFAPLLKDQPPHLPIFDEALAEIPEKAKIKKAKLTEEAARSIDPGRIKKVRKASYGESLSRIALINSNGLNFSYSSSLVSASANAVAEEAGESEMGWDFDFSHFFNDLDAESVGRKAGTKALERLGGKKIPSGRYPILLHNEVASEFLSLLAHSFLAEQIQKGKSYLKGKKGEKFFSPLLFIVDDGLYPKGISSSPVDGEGMPCHQTVLVTQGELSEYLYDRYWAHRENLNSVGSRVKSTGSSRRSSIKLPPGIGISNLYIKPGKYSLLDLMKEVQRGVAIKEVMGLHTADPISGDFSLGCSGDWIQRGERAYPIKSIAVAGNLFQLFRNVIGIGEDLRFFGRVGAPSLWVEGLEISGS